MSKQLYMWDFTIPFDEYYHQDLKLLKDKLSSNCKKWVFQREIGKTSDYDHLQGRISLRKKAVASTIISLFKSMGDVTHGVHLTPTTKTCVDSNNFSYVMKDDTRYDGPWSDQDPKEVPDTIQMKLFKQWDKYPWQQTILDMIQVFDMRAIDIIYDPNGHEGKSIFAEYLETQGSKDTEIIPPYRLMDDIFQWVCGIPGKKAYLVDMPRGMKKDSLGDFYAGIEVIKNGMAYDKRYKRQKVWFSRPRIFIFTNTLPAFDLMSKDRWNVWIINDQLELETYNYDECEL